MAFSRDTYTSAGEATFTITRTSNQSARLVDYVDASVFKADTLDDDILQAFYVSQEALDNASELSLQINAAGDEWDAESLEIQNLVGGTDNNDAVAYGQMVNYVAAAAGVPDPSAVASGSLLASNGSTLAWSEDLQTYVLTFDDNTAAAGPTLELYRTSTAPQTAAVSGTIRIKGQNDVGEDVTYAEIRGDVIDETDATENGAIIIRTITDGATANVLHIRDGLFMQGATGNSMGAGTINASGIYDDGVQFGPDVDTSWSGAQRGTLNELTDAATVAIDFNDSNNFYVTVTADRTIGQPSNQTAGQCGFLIIEQDGTGGHTTSFHADWDWGAAGTPTFDTTANKKGVVAYFVDWDTTVIARFLGDF